MKRDFISVLSKFTFSLILILGITGCKDDENAEAPKDPIVEKYNIEYDTSAQSNLNVFIAKNGIKDCFLQAFNERFTNPVKSIDQADVVIIDSKEMANYSSELKAFLERGGTLLEVEPDVKVHEAFMNSIGKKSFIPEGGKMSLLAISGNGDDIYALGDIFAEAYNNDDCYEDIEDDNYETFDIREDNRTYFDYFPVETGETMEYVNTMLSPLIDWMDDIEVSYASSSSEEPAVPSTINEITKLIEQDGYSQHLRYSYPVKYDNWLICRKGMNDCRATRSSTVEYDITVVPVYAFQETSPGNTGGDYYIIKMNAISHNKDMCSDTFQRHYIPPFFGTETYGFPFHLREMEMTLQLEDRTSNPIDANNISFFHDPVPQSTQGSTTYTSGFSTSFSFNANVGFMGTLPMGNLTLGPNFTWSNSTSTTMSDLMIELNTNMSTRSVNYRYKLNENAIGYKDDLEKCIPACARTDRYDKASWCWHVNNTKDDSDENLWLAVTINPKYGVVYRHCTWWAEKQLIDAGSPLTNGGIVFRLKAPDRTRKGFISLKSTNSNYMTKVAIADKSGKIVARYNGATEKNKTVIRQLPIGKYTIEYDIYNGETSEKIHSYRIENVEVKTAATTECTTLDAKPIDERKLK